MIFTKPVRRKVSAEAPPIITDGLVGYWPFDEGSGLTANDNTVSGNDGSLLNMDASNWVAGSGVGGYDLRFNGTDESVDMGNDTPEIAFEYDEPFSYVAWVTPDSGGTGGGQFIIGKKAHSGTTERGVDLYLGSGTTGFRLQFRLTNSTSSPARQALIRSIDEEAVPAGVRTNVVATYNGNGLTSGMTIYVAGNVEPNESVFNNLANTTIVTGQNFTVGGRNNLENWFKGLIDAPRVYNRVLTAGEIAQIAAGTG